MSYKTNVDAHRTSLSALTISQGNTLAATASVKGTIIRVFSLPEGELMFNFKRGISQA